MAAPIRREDIQPAILRRLDQRQRRPAAPRAAYLSQDDGTDAVHIGVLDDGTPGIRVFNDDATASVTLDYDTIRALIALIP